MKHSILIFSIGFISACLLTACSEETEIETTTQESKTSIPAIADQKPIVNDAVNEFSNEIVKKTNNPPYSIMLKNLNESKSDNNISDKQMAKINIFAQRFVKLALAIGQHDPAFVDAYQGPKEWQTEATTAARSLDNLSAAAANIITAIDALKLDDNARVSMLKKQLVAAQTRLSMLQGNTFSFDEETSLLYDAVAPQYDVGIFDFALESIDKLLPGEGDLLERVEAFEALLAIPENKLQMVFNEAIDECKRRTAKHFELPESENFKLEFVNDKPWSGYNWYKGKFTSLIQVNTDFPISISRAIDLGCHEGYPGHHAWNVILERDILKNKNWIEYSVYPLFSPLSLIAEGTANYGIELAFPGEEKMQYERDVLYPLAGINPNLAVKHQQLQEARKALSHAGNHIAREYLDGRISKEEAITLNMKYGLRTREKAEQSINFVETYRGYVINYNLGQDLVKEFIDRNVARGVDPWDAFEHILKNPMSASDLKK